LTREARARDTVRDVKRLDVLLAAGLTIAMVFEVWAEHLKPEVVSSVGMVVGGVSLAWRRVYPIAVTLVFVSISVAQAGAGMSMHSAVSPVIGLLVCSWSIGAYEDRRRALLGLTLLVCGIWVGMGIDVLRGTDRYEATDVPWIGTLILLPGVLGMLFGARTRSLRAAEARAVRLELEQREAVAAERSRIARELHDVIAHSVAVMTVQAGAAEEMLKQDPARALEPVRAVQETGRQALAEMKRLVGILREGDHELGLEPQPGVADLERLVAHVREAGLAVDLRVEGKPRPLPIGVDLSAYRVVQEALTNALKHAQASSAVVVLRYRDDDLSIEITDDGVGASSAGSGHGLAGMRERIAVFGGRFDAGPGERGGFAVRALLPLQAAP
jgi:signal transduction histidine kinase